MEDVELSRRLKAVGRPLLIPDGITVSTRRWERQPFMGRVDRVTHLSARYLLLRGSGRDQGAAEHY